MLLLTKNSPISRWLQGWLSLSPTQGCSSTLGQFVVKAKLSPCNGSAPMRQLNPIYKKEPCFMWCLFFALLWVFLVRRFNCSCVASLWILRLLTCLNVFLIWGEASYERLVWCLLWFTNVSSLHVPLKLNIDYYACQKVGCNIFLWVYGIYCWFSGLWPAWF